MSSNLYIPPRAEFSGTVTFRAPDNSSASLKISKTDTDQVVYAFAVEYLGQKFGDPKFQVSVSVPAIPEVNTRQITIPTWSTGTSGSRMFEADVVDGVIRVIETDDNASCTLYANPKAEKCQLSQIKPAVNAPATTASPADTPVRKPISLNGVDEKITALVMKGMVFKPEDGKTIRKILRCDRFVILYASDGNGGRDIYIATKVADEFIKCESEMLGVCRCDQSDSEWEVKLPGESTAHKLAFALGSVTGGHPFQTSWDDLKLFEMAL